MMTNIVTGVLKNSIAEEMGLEIGDILLEINGKHVNDVFDYRFLISDEYIEVLIEKQNGDQWLLEIEKDETEDLGLSFSEPMMDKATSCGNKCIFCFIDQLPKGMRNTLYFKDDDSRLSFLQGNYVTLTNISDKDLDRIIYYHLSPINVSVHTANEDLRIKMLGNKNAGKIMEQLERMSFAGIEINCQIVLIKGINDCNELSESIDRLMSVKGVKSLSVVPVGLTKYREGLTPITAFDKSGAIEAIAIIHEKRKIAFTEKGTGFVYAGDEFYMLGEMPLPPYEYYDGFPQLENGVGMVRLFEHEFDETYESIEGDDKQRKVSVVTGKSAFGFIRGLCNKLMTKFTNTHIDVIMVANSFFGENVTVSGLLTGNDIIAELEKRCVKGRVLLPVSCFKAEEDILLDGVTLNDINALSGVSVAKAPCNGTDFVLSVLDERNRLYNTTSL